MKTLRRIILPLYLLVTAARRAMPPRHLMSLATLPRGAPRIQHLRLMVTRHQIQRSLARTIVRKVPRGNPLRVIVTTIGAPTSLLVTATTRGAPTRIQQHLRLLVTATRAMPARFLLVQNWLSLAISQHSFQQVESSFTVHMTLTHHIMYVSWRQMNQYFKQNVQECSSLKVIRTTWPRVNIIWTVNGSKCSTGIRIGMY